MIISHKVKCLFIFLVPITNDISKLTNYQKDLYQQFLSVGSSISNILKLISQKSSKENLPYNFVSIYFDVSANLSDRNTCFSQPCVVGIKNLNSKKTHLIYSLNYQTPSSSFIILKDQQNPNKIIKISSLNEVFLYKGVNFKVIEFKLVTVFPKSNGNQLIKEALNFQTEQNIQNNKKIQAQLIQEKLSSNYAHAVSRVKMDLGKLSQTEKQKVKSLSMSKKEQIKNNINPYPPNIDNDLPLTKLNQIFIGFPPENSFYPKINLNKKKNVFMKKNEKELPKKRKNFSLPKINDYKKYENRY